MELGSIHLNLRTVLLTMMMFKWGTLCTATADRCLSAPCQNGSSCVDTVDDYACICATEGVRYMGKNCDQLYDACSFAPCENCSSTPGTAQYSCRCLDGFTGDNCTQEVNECASNPCLAPRSLCVDQLNGYFCRCPEGFGGRQCRTHVSDCLDLPCQNNGTCHLQPEGFQCRCAPGFQGETCAENVDECGSEPCQNGAICVDGVAEFHCFCVPGFQGTTCEIDINECASRPCENNATCINEKDHYQCECLLGFAGINCEKEIDECESGPCQNRATCHDLVGMYSCECVAGFEGLDCELDIDECASAPCLNGGVCHDMENSYQCDCSHSGFEGEHCEVDIPECDSSPCQHGAVCVEGVRGYSCLCWPGFEGANCEVDIDECAENPCENGGECFQRSQLSHWELDWELSFADASGYVCQCNPGFAGENCSVNINECESEPCLNWASCEDRINGFACSCPSGFLGELCEVNIDECDSQPCQNGGWCEDAVASYTCHCSDPDPGELPWGGAHCQVKLSGCVDHRCQNGATCLPWLRGEEHGHSCACPPGFSDDYCSTGTTFSFSTPGFIHLHVVETDRRRRDAEHHRHRGFDLQLRFRTTVPNALLFFRGDDSNHLLLEIADKVLRAKFLSGVFQLEVIFHGSVSDGDWWDVHVFVDDRSLVLVIKGHGCEGDVCKVVDSRADGTPPPSEAFTQTYIGGAPGHLLEYSLSEANFIGCMEDLVIDSTPVLPESLPDDHSYELGCVKTAWCEPDPCGGRGDCVDLWISYQCVCYRPFHGESCSEEFPSWTYSHEDTLSFSSHDIAKPHGSNFNVSLVLRTNKADGLLLQLRRPVKEVEGEEGGGEAEWDVYFSVYLAMGRVLVSSLPNSAPLTAPVFVSTGESQLLQVEVQQSQVVFEHGGLRYGLGEIPAVSISGGDRAYVGGLPGNMDPEGWGGHYKGCLQDLRLDSVHLAADSLRSSDETAAYWSREVSHVTDGCVSDDACKAEPCLNGGECSVTFNDFSCSCPADHTGKTCQTRVWCVSDPCAGGGRCVDLPDGYECLYSATFDNEPVHYSAGGSLTKPVSDIYMELRTRSENAVLLRAWRATDLLMVSLLDSAVRVDLHVSSRDETLAFTGVRRVADGLWHRVNISMSNQGHKSPTWVISVDGILDASSLPQHAGSITFLNQKEATLTVAESFTGCLGTVRVGGVYLPFVDDFKAPQSSQFYLDEAPGIHLGCSSAPVCDPDPCLNGATCQDIFNKFSCACDPGWEGETCETDTDDCGSQPCVHGSCRDHLGGFECECLLGYAGPRCEVDIDDCAHHACEHGGTCKDGPNQYTCVCPKDYRGPLCQWQYPPIQCGEDLQCVNDGVCSDGPWGANCTCVPGFTGRRCETEVNECESNPCRNGASCLDRFNMFVCDCPPGFSGTTCDSNKQAQRQGAHWLMVAIPLLCFCVLIMVLGLAFMVLTARKKRQSEGVYSPSAQEVAGARMEMDSMLKVPPEERLI